MENVDFQVLDLSQYENVLNEINELEKKLEQELGQTVALVAYSDYDNKSKMA